MSSGEPSQSSNRKLDLYAIARIIESLKESGPMNKTSLATSTGIAYDRLGKYIDWMISKGFVAVRSAENDGSRETVSLSEDGLKAYEEFVAWILRYVGRIRFPKLDRA